jgi:hypothetical protein
VDIVYSNTVCDDHGDVLVQAVFGTNGVAAVICMHTQWPIGLCQICSCFDPACIDSVVSGMLVTVSEQPIYS